MQFTPSTTYQVGSQPTMTVALALELAPPGRVGHDEIVWWGNALCKVTYHTSESGGYVLDSVWASIPH